MAMRFLSTLVLCATAYPCYAASDPLEEAKALYERTEYATSLRVLNSRTAQDFAGYLLMGENHFMLGDYAKAGQFFDKALSLDPSSSEGELWLARNYGRRAETGGFLLAAGNASKARQHFEKSVALDSHNAEALNDLFDYYLNAPEILGGGLDKAEAIAHKIAAERPAESHFELAQIAERRKRPAEAESHLRQAAELAPRQVGRVLDLARFLAKAGRIPESDAAFSRASQLAPRDPRVLFARAKTYIEQHRNREQAGKLLQEYMESALTPDDPPKSTAEKLLRQAGGG